jgi:hypothetical protein
MEKMKAKSFAELVLDSRPPWQRGGLLFCRSFLGKVTVEHAEGRKAP